MSEMSEVKKRKVKPLKDNLLKDDQLEDDHYIPWEDLWDYESAIYPEDQEDAKQPVKAS